MLYQQTRKVYFITWGGAKVQFERKYSRSLATDTQDTQMLQKNNDIKIYVTGF